MTLKLPTKMMVNRTSWMIRPMRSLSKVFGTGTVPLPKPVTREGPRNDESELRTTGMVVLAYCDTGSETPESFIVAAELTENIMACQFSAAFLFFPLSVFYLEAFSLMHHQFHVEKIETS